MQVRLAATAVLVSAVFLCGLAIGQTPAETHPNAAAAQPQGVGPSTSSTPPELTKADLDAWLDGFFPQALATSDIAGAVVVVVKDGQVLTEKGYGYADIESRRKIEPGMTMWHNGPCRREVGSGARGHDGRGIGDRGL